MLTNVIIKKIFSSIKYGCCFYFSLTRFYSILPYLCKMYLLLIDYIIFNLLNVKNKGARSINRWAIEPLF